MYYRQPRYYSKFCCSGEECKANCCYGWAIVWKKDEIEKLKGAPNCSDELREKIEKGFVPSIDGDETSFVINLDQNEKCPFQREDGLCEIQKELGAKYLSKTCTLFPRYNSFIDLDKNIVYRGCVMSCQEVVRMLVNEENAAELVNIPIKEKKLNVSMKYNYKEKDIFENPGLKYRLEIFSFFYDLIGDKNCSLETTMVLGALAAQKLTQLINNDQFSRIPEALKAFRKQTNDSAAIRSIDGIKPNYNVKFGVANKITESALSFNISDTLKDQNGALDVDRYISGEEKLGEMMKDKPFWLRNIALAMLLDSFVPFTSLKHTVFENYSFFVAAISCIKLNAIASAYAPEEINITFQDNTLHFKGIEKIYGLTGMISRRIFQDATAFKNVTKVLNEYDMDSPAYLALLIK